MSVLLGGGTRVVAGVGGASSWQLPSGYFVDAKMAMQVTYPRPDGETPTWARHRHAYPGMQYRVPIVVQGGAFPFRYEVVSGPAGLTVGKAITDANYGIVTWTPSGTGAAQSVTIRVTDQQLNAVNVTWSITPNTAQFIFVDANAGTSGSGTLASPLKTFADVHLGSASDRTFAEKIMVLRGGTHTITGWAANNNNWNLQRTGGSPNKPPSWIGYPGEAVMLNGSSANVVMNLSDTGNDVFYGGVTLSGSRTDVADNRTFFFGAGSGTRASFFEMAFSNIQRGTAGTDNPGAIVMFDNTSARQYVSIIGCSLDDFNAPLCDLYHTWDAVIDNITIGASSVPSYAGQMVYTKSRNARVSIRRVTSTQSLAGVSVVTNSWSFGTPSAAAQTIECCYSKLRVASGNVVSMNAETGAAAAGSHYWLYRNTLVGDFYTLSSANEAYTVERNTIITNQNPLFPWVTATVADNLQDTRANIGAVLDGTYNLTGSARTTWLGRRGHEISAGV